MLDRYRIRQWANLLNLSTPLGRGLAALGNAHTHPWENGLTVATNHQLPYPPAAAFTVGNVVLVRATYDELLALDAKRPELMIHEARHATQFAFCLGPVMVPLYLGACSWSWIRTGDWWSNNVFERRAGLSEGGYHRNATRSERKRLLRG